MAQPIQLVNIGANSNDGTGDPARVAFAKINGMFTAIFGGNSGLPVFAVSALPNPVAQGTQAYVIDALAPAYLQPLIGGGTVFCPALFNGTSWVAA